MKRDKEPWGEFREGSWEHDMVAALEYLWNFWDRGLWVHQRHCYEVFILLAFLSVFF